MRAPELGKFKGRLTPGPSPPVVAKLYRCLVTDTLDTLSSAGFETIVWVRRPGWWASDGSCPAKS